MVVSECEGRDYPEFRFYNNPYLECNNAYEYDRQNQETLFTAAHVMGGLAAASTLMMGIVILCRGIRTRRLLAKKKEQDATLKIAKKPCCNNKAIAVLSSMVAAASCGISIAIPFLIKRFEDDLCDAYGFTTTTSTRHRRYRSRYDRYTYWYTYFYSRHCYGKPERIEIAIDQSKGFFITLCIVSFLVSAFSIIYSCLLRKWKKQDTKVVELAKATQV